MERTYEPTIARGEQGFVANVVSVTKRLIAFGDLLPKRGKALRFGTPIHSLLIHLDGANSLFELNDQGNTRTLQDIETLTLSDTALRIVFHEGCGPFSGRVSLSPEIDVFDRDRHRPRQLRSVLVVAKLTEAKLRRIEQSFVEHLGATRPTRSRRRRHG